MGRKLVYETPETMGEVGGAVNSITIANLAGKNAEYEIEGRIHIVNASGSDQFLLCRINGVNSGYASSFDESNIANGSASHPTPTVNGGGNTGLNIARTHMAGGCDVKFKAEIYNPPENNYIRMKCDALTTVNSQSWLRALNQGNLGVDAEITSMVLSLSGSVTMYGVIRVYKVE